MLDPVDTARGFGSRYFEWVFVMWPNDQFGRRFGLPSPIVQGPFGGGVSSVGLTAAVSEAGGLGSFGANNLAADQILAVIEDIRSRTSKPFAINLWIPAGGSSDIDTSNWAAVIGRFAAYYRELGLAVPAAPPARFIPPFESQIEAILQSAPPVFSFVFGVPEEGILRECRRRGILTIGTATTVEEAVVLADAGVDAVVATGFEAGGHRPSFLKPAEQCLNGLMSLVPQVVDAIDIPVIAAGGIADGRGLAAALTLGAQGVQIGTAFLASDESGAVPVHKDAILSTTPRPTVLTRAFSGRLVRAIRNRWTDEFGSDAPPPYPIMNWISSSLRKAAIDQRRTDLLSLQVGQSAPLAKSLPAVDLMRRIESQALDILDRGAKR